MSRIILSFAALIFSSLSLFANGNIKLQQLTSTPLVFGGIDTNMAQATFWARGSTDGFTSYQMIHPEIFKPFGVVQIGLTNGVGEIRTCRFELDANHDYIGTGYLSDLVPGHYKYKVGYCVSNIEKDHLYRKRLGEMLDAEDKYDFTGCQEGAFHVTDPNTDHLSFVFGSCRLYTKLWKFTLFGTGKKADIIFKSILDDIDEQSQQGIETDFFMNVGDHVYYDHLGPFFRKKTLDKMRKLYRKVRDYEHLNALLSTTTLFAMGDDHDMHVDNSNYKKRHDEPAIFAAGMQAYKEYQHPGGPSDATDHMWYSFKRAMADFFVLDTRSERDERLKDEYGATKLPTLISTAQFKAFKKWITSPRRNGRVTFVVTPVSLAGENNLDGWMGCPEQQKEMLALIADKPNTFILTGDSHGTRCDTYDVFDTDGTKLGSVTELMSSGLKSATFAIPENFPDELDITDAGGVKFVRTSGTKLYPYASRPKAHKGWIRKRIGTYVKGVFMRVTIDKTKGTLDAIIHDTNMTDPVVTSYDLDFDEDSFDPDTDNPDLTELADAADSDDDLLEKATPKRKKTRKKEKRLSYCEAVAKVSPRNKRPEIAPQKKRVKKRKKKATT